ncbi:MULTISPECIES: outer membrane beta-barrel protein [Prevotellaceae]|uniref:outer membrane beta-barrel protein n=1 Tax=Prevotellaceae TaxID=171552 RepID=UPI0003D2F379|nr:outer membrane beta-barrel protein [Prevotella phocaeensis]ETD19631.1 hypothetical protein HMPREF1199_01001 [Hoylesella oralis CC98A]
MKKFFMTLAAAIIAVSASAQVYVGGNVGISSVKIAGGDSETAYKFLPEFGYNIDRDWAVGMVVGWGKGNPVEIEEGLKNAAKTFEINPYVRYTALHSKYVNVFFDGSVGYRSYKNVGSEYSFGIKPGLSVNLNDRFSFVAHVGFLGYKCYDPKADNTKNSSAWGVDVNGNNVTFGVYYNF